MSLTTRQGWPRQIVVRTAWRGRTMQLQQHPAIQSLRMRLYILLRPSQTFEVDPRLQQSRTILRDLLDRFVADDRFINEEAGLDYLQLLRFERFFMVEGQDSMRGHLIEKMISEIEQAYRLGEIEVVGAKAA